MQVIGVPDEQYGEEIMACVILKEGETMTEEEMKRICVGRTWPSTRCPGTSTLSTAFPMNAAGKILKYKMREEAIARLKLQKAAGIETA